MTELDLVDAQRFADVMETIEAGDSPDLDPREDPTLTALASLAAEIRDVERFATETPRFRSYRTRSRAYVLRSIERSARVPTREERGPRGIPFLNWHVLAPVASAAAVAVLVLAFVAVQQSSISSRPGRGQLVAIGTASVPDAPVEVPGSPLPFEVEPLLPGLEEQFVAASIERDLSRIDSLIVQVGESVAADRPVDPELLRGITESIASVADRIEAEPDSLLWVQVIDYLQSAGFGRSLLAAARTDAASESALSAARRTTQDGVDVAMSYFAQRQ